MRFDRLLLSMFGWLVISPAVLAQRTSTPPPIAPVVVPAAPTVVPPPLPKTPAAPTVVAPPPPPPPPPPTNKKSVGEDLNNPLEAPQDIERILSTRMNADRWALMYSPLNCLDISLTCVQSLQSEAVANSPIIKGLDAKIQDINSKIAEAKTNNRKSIDLAIFEPALQVFIAQKTVVEKGESRTVGFLDRIAQIFTNPGGLVNDLLSVAGIPLLRGLVGGSDAQQSRSIQISDLGIATGYV